MTAERRPPIDPLYFSTGDVAARLGYSNDQVRRMCEQGRFDGDGAAIPGAYRVGVGGHWRIPAAAVELFLASTRPLRRAIR